MCSEKCLNRKYCERTIPINNCKIENNGKILIKSSAEDRRHYYGDAVWFIKDNDTLLLRELHGIDLVLLTIASVYGDEIYLYHNDMCTQKVLRSVRKSLNNNYIPAQTIRNRIQSLIKNKYINNIDKSINPNMIMGEILDKGDDVIRERVLSRDKIVMSALYYQCKDIDTRSKLIIFKDIYGLPYKHIMKQLQPLAINVFVH